MNMKNPANRLLGYPDDARLLIVNADDLGVCHAVNHAIFGALPHGIVRSTTLMMPCIGASEAVQFLQEHPQYPFGIHLTAICDNENNCFAPMLPREKVPSLVQEIGLFYYFDDMQRFLVNMNLKEVEAEFRTQIEAVLAAGLHPTHLDWHSLRIDNRMDLFELMFRLAREYHLAQRVFGQGPMNALAARGLPCVDGHFLDSYQLDPQHKPDLYAGLMHELPAGLSEWAVHPGLDGEELDRIEPTGNHVRQADYDFLTSPYAAELIQKEGIILLDYRALQSIWNSIV
jgi:chitin disaccharide deacetylase